MVGVVGMIWNHDCVTKKYSYFSFLKKKRKHHHD
jgi:hypothetical protein